MSDNPFAVLTTVVAPAILTNACSVLALGTSNRIARVVDRAREISGFLLALKAGDPECAYWERQIRILRVRARYLFWALRLTYTSLGAFASAALVAVIGSAVASTGMQTVFRVSAILGLVVGALGVVGLAIGCALMVHEVRLALAQTREESEHAIRHGDGSCRDQDSDDTDPIIRPLPY